LFRLNCLFFSDSTSLTALAIVGARAGNNGAINRHPIRSWELILAKITPYILVSFADTFDFGAGNSIFGVPIRGSIILLFVMTGLYLLPHLAMDWLFNVARTNNRPN